MNEDTALPLLKALWDEVNRFTWLTLTGTEDYAEMAYWMQRLGIAASDCDDYLARHELGTTEPDAAAVRENAL